MFEIANRLHDPKNRIIPPGSDGVEYSTFEYEYRVLALRIFKYEYWWLTSSTSTSITSSSTSTEYIFPS